MDWSVSRIGSGDPGVEGKRKGGLKEKKEFLGNPFL